MNRKSGVSTLFTRFGRRFDFSVQEWRNRKCQRLLRRSACTLEGAIVQLGSVFPHIENKGKIDLGRAVCFRGLVLPVQLFSRNGGRLAIEKVTFVNQGSTICAAALVEIGPYCRIGEYVHISDSAFHPVSPITSTKIAPIRIGRNVWIGTRAIILPGVSIGAHSVIGAGAVVTSDVEARTVVGGVPARPISTFECPDDWHRP
ncbi:MAG: acyltransferase [Verrucomicrobia bacterium]|jgi:acetyltransferase-like isoleucine patch superfamily enzyme|nr:acyltransferase [Verrucomicrobiota bacterium]